MCKGGSCGVDARKSGVPNSKSEYARRRKALKMEALLLSIKLAICVSAILLLCGVPLAYWLANSQWRGKFLLESIVALPLVLPPTLLGFYVLVALAPRAPLLTL